MAESLQRLRDVLTSLGATPYAPVHDGAIAQVVCLYHESARGDFLDGGKFSFAPDIGLLRCRVSFSGYWTNTPIRLDIDRTVEVFGIERITNVCIDARGQFNNRVEGGATLDSYSLHANKLYLPSQTLLERIAAAPQAVAIAARKS